MGCSEMKDACCLCCCVSAAESAEQHAYHEGIRSCLCRSPASLPLGNYRGPWFRAHHRSWSFPCRGNGLSEYSQAFRDYVVGPVFLEHEWLWKLHNVWHCINTCYHNLLIPQIHVVHYNSKYANLTEAASKVDGLAVLGGFIGVRVITNFSGCS